MTATFLIHLSVDDTSPTSLAGLAEQLMDDLQDAGHAVQSVASWTRPSEQGPTIGGLPIAPPISTPLF